MTFHVTFDDDFVSEMKSRVASLSNQGRGTGMSEIIGVEVTSGNPESFKPVIRCQYCRELVVIRATQAARGHKTCGYNCGKSPQMRFWKYVKRGRDSECWPWEGM